MLDQQPCACERLAGRGSTPGSAPRPAEPPCAKEILTGEEERVLGAMRELRRQARELKEELGRIEGRDRLLVRRRYLEMTLAALREQFRTRQRQLQRANRAKHIRLGHLEPGGH